MSGRNSLAASAYEEGLTMDEQRFDNVARRLGGLRSRRDALKTAGCGAVAVLAAFGLENSALAQQLSVADTCLAPGVPCQKSRQCCGFRRQSKKIRCKLSNAGTGNRCCGQRGASCFDDNDCCLNNFCNLENKCVIA
jgi:hypothetical protein